MILLWGQVRQQCQEGGSVGVELPLWLWHCIVELSDGCGAGGCAGKGWKEVEVRLTKGRCRDGYALCTAH